MSQSLQQNLVTLGLNLCNKKFNLTYRVYGEKGAPKMTKVEVIKRLVNAGFGLPQALKIYNKLSGNGFYEVERTELNSYIKKNGF